MIEVIVGGLSSAAKYIIPTLLVGIPFYALAVKKVKVYEVFVVGAKDGFTIAVRIIPYLVAILVAVGMFRASGALDLLLNLLSPALNFIGFPPENLPLALMRPLSGSGSRLVDRPGQRIRRRLDDCKNWCNDVRLFRDDVLCAGRLLRICWRGSQPPCDTGRLDSRRRGCT